jgi:hypothetical protein
MLNLKGWNVWYYKTDMSFTVFFYTFINVLSAGESVSKDGLTTLLAGIAAD